MADIIKLNAIVSVNLPDPLKKCVHRFDGRQNNGRCLICGKSEDDTVHFKEQSDG